LINYDAIFLGAAAPTMLHIIGAGAPYKY